MKGQITQGNVKDYVGPGGARFVIKPTTLGLFQVIMESGGKRPKICDGKFTSYNKAEFALKAYIMEQTQYRGKAATPKEE